MGIFHSSASEQRPVKAVAEIPGPAGNTNPRKKHGNIPL
jgi:hypothetical protein